MSAAYIFAHLLVDEPKFDALSAPGIVFPPLSTSSFNELSILNSIFPFDPESTHSTDESPSKILSATIPVSCAQSPLNDVAVTIPDALICFVKNVVPVTVDIPANVNVPPTGVIPSKVST